MAKRTLAKDQDKFVLRLPEGMRDQLKAEADAHDWSLNAEIVARLEAADSIQSVRADFELAKSRIISLQNLADSRANMVEMLAKAVEDAKERERELQEYIGKLLAALEKANEQQERMMKLLESRIS
jgi:plasmid stability protein